MGPATLRVPLVQEVSWDLAVWFQNNHHIIPWEDKGKDMEVIYITIVKDQGRDKGPLIWIVEIRPP